MADFLITYGHAEEVYSQLKAQFTVLTNALDDLNATLAGLDGELHGKAVPLWQDLQTKWNSNYENMATDLNVGSQVVDAVTNTYDDTDRTTAQIFG